MARKKTIKCNGCGYEIWSGSRIIDGYCHDCYARGRHLPPIVEAPPWSPQKKKQKTQPVPVTSSITRRKFWPRFSPKIPSIPRAALLFLTVAAIGLGLYLSIPALTERFRQTTGEAGAMNLLRDLRYSDFINRGERIPGETLPADIEAITAFMNGSHSYRMNGIFEYAIHDSATGGRERKARSNIEMSYNSGLNVYRFIISNSGDNTGRLSHLLIADGTYYIIRENGTTYVLHHGGGRRTATDIRNNRAVYDFLMGLAMKNVVKTGFITGKGTVARHYMGGGMYAIAHNDVGTGLKIYGSSQYRTELRTYQHRPITWHDCNRDKKTRLEWQKTAGFYYDSIPTDAPVITDWDKVSGSSTAQKKPAQSATPSSPVVRAPPSPPSATSANITVMLDSTVYAPGKTMSATVKNLPREMSEAKAFVAIYNKGAAHRAYGEYRYPARGDSVLEFTAPGRRGSYEIRLYRQDHVYTDKTFVLKVPFTVGTVSPAR